MQDSAELAEAVREMHAATARVVELLETERQGVHTAEQWVALRCGVSSGRARRLVAIARRLPELPETAAAFAAGELSEDQVALLCAHECGEDGMALAGGRTVAELRRALADVRPRGEAKVRRRVAFGHDQSDNVWRLFAELPPDEGAAVERALVAARDPKGDWADALLTMAERSMNGRRGRGRTTVLLHVRMDEEGPQGHLHLGPAVPEPLRRHLSCDSWVRLLFEKGGKSVSMGREMRVVPERTRVVVEERDRGCRVPGCDRTKWLQIHHIIHWEDGGPTDTWNLVALCHAHHRLHHHGQLQIYGNADEPDGLVIGAVAAAAAAA